MSDEKEPTTHPRVSPTITYAPIKKRIHTDMTSIVVGDARKVLFGSGKHRRTGVLFRDDSSTECNDGEEAVESKQRTVESVNRRMVCLQVAAFIFDNIPSISPLQLKSSLPIKKRVKCTMKLGHDQYLAVFANLGKRKDLSHLAEPPEDAFDLFCQYWKQDGRTKHFSKTVLQENWARLSKEEKEQYERQLEKVKKVYNKEFCQNEEKKKMGNLPLYESRTITDLSELEAILGPMSLRRTFSGYRTVAGQIPVVVEVYPPLKLVYDESDQSLQFHFSVSNQKVYSIC
ncbi:hypothetical protein WA171_003629 [Blastocystis sp. BT1]